MEDRDWEMADVQKMGNVDSLSWHFGPGASKPDYTTILEHLQDYKASRIGKLVLLYPGRRHRPIHYAGSSMGEEKYFPRSS